MLLFWNMEGRPGKRAGHRSSSYFTKHLIDHVGAEMPSAVVNPARNSMSYKADLAVSLFLVTPV